MKTVQILSLCMVIAVVSFLGFVVENVWLSVTKGFMDNRNMCLPFLLGYGLAIIAIYALFGIPADVLLFGKRLEIKSKLISKMVYFLIVMVCVSVGEIMLGKFVELTCDFYWWDYSRLPLHITRYTTIPTSLGFATMISLFMDYVFIPLQNRFMMWDYYRLEFMAKILMALMIGDFVYNAYKMKKNGNVTTRWKIDTTETKGYKLLHHREM